MASVKDEEKEAVSEEKKAIVVLISGAAGQIGYSLIPLFANGQVFGADQPLILRLLEIEVVMKALKGVAMEIDDGAYPLVEEVVCTSKASVAFKDADYAVLVGGFPRKKGMLRKDLLAKNGPIFKSMGEGLEQYAKKTCKVLVVANPANTNCLVCSKYAPKIPKKNFAALTRLDYNRATSQIANKLKIQNKYVSNIVIWGNHSATQVPDINNAIAIVNGKEKKVFECVDNKYVNEFRKLVQQRGKAIIEARGFSSAMSAANGTKDCLRDWVKGTPKGKTVAMAVYSDGSYYGIAKDIFYSFPVTCNKGEYTVIKDYKVTEEVKKLMKASEKELLEERDEAGCGDTKKEEPKKEEPKKEPKKEEPKK